MKISLIVAFDENRLIGRDNGLPWHLPADLKHFKALTMGHHMIMGRKTYESIGKPLPGRTTVIVTRQTDYLAEGCIVTQNFTEAMMQCAGQSEVFIIGGAQIFECTLPLADTLYVTQIHHAFEGDTFFPEIKLSEWDEINRERHEGDEKNQWAYSFITYKKK
ncbi:MAG: dihydrofolate reductase [Bacteroidetes bacterium]|nr:dihydrofolate reductase [Bacteroidota bacterium]